MSERMSEERLKHIKDRYDHYGEAALGGGELLAEIDALRAELAAARTVEDGEIASTVEELSYYTPGMLAPRSLMKQAADLLTRLSAAKAEAERLADAAFPVVPDKETKVTLAVLEVVASGQKSLSAGGAKSTADLIKRIATERDQYRQAMETYCGAMTKATAAQVESERRLATAREALGEAQFAILQLLPEGFDVKPTGISQLDEASGRVLAAYKAALAALQPAKEPTP